MLIRSGLGGLTALLIAMTGASAAPATSEQASAIKAAIERYVGGGTGGASPVAVTPENDHYSVAIDLKQAFHVLERFGFALDPATYAMSATPLEGGTWRVASSGVPRITAKHGDNSYSVIVNNAKFEGVFDPDVLGFQTSSFAYDSMSIAVVTPQGGTQTREINRGRQTSTGTTTGEGIASVQIAQHNDGFSQDVHLDVPGPNGAPGLLSLKSASETANLAVDDLHSRAITELWAFFVEHPDEEAIKASQTDLKNLLRKALPLFRQWSQGGSAEHLSIDSPFGAFTAEHIGGQFKTTGLVQDGKIEADLHYDGATIPTGLVPGWAEGLVPTTAALQQSFAGFHLDTVGQQVIDGLSFDTPDLLSTETVQKLRESVGPLERMVATLGPSHFESKDLKLDLDGEVRLTKPLPDFSVNIRASGLDQALQNIQARAEGDKNASQLIAVLVLAKGLGKAGTDGSLSWAVTKSGAGDVLINGLSLPSSGR